MNDLNITGRTRQTRLRMKWIRAAKSSNIESNKGSLDFRVRVWDEGLDDRAFRD